MTTTILMVGILCLMTAAICAHLFLTANRTSKMTTPIPPTPQIQTSPDSALLMLQTMKEMSETSQREMRELVVTLVQGREPPPPIGERVIGQTMSDGLTSYDDDSIPLPDGIQAILEREVEEDSLRDSMRQRSALQDRIRELTNEMNSLQLLDSETQEP